MKVHAIIFLFMAAGILISGFIVIQQSISNLQQNSNQFVQKSINETPFETLKQEYLAKSAKTPYRVPITILNKYPSNVDFCNAFCNTNCIVENRVNDSNYINVYC
ncbi:Uncharacterised protein [uncultured archaeon]|nr:Uncharacterised protein [uncultured archaeon]